MPCLLLYLTHGAGSTDHHSFQTAYARSVTSGNCSGEHCMSTRLTDGLPRWLGKHYSWVCLWVCLWKRLTYESIDWVKMTAFPNVSRHYQSIEGLSKTKRWEKGAFFLWAEISYSPALDHWLLDSYQDLDHWPLILRPLNLNWMTRLTFLVFYLADGRLWDFSAFQTMWANSCKSLCLSALPPSFYLYLSLNISPIGLFLWGTLTNIQVLLEKCTVRDTVIAGCSPAMDFAVHGVTKSRTWLSNWTELNCALSSPETEWRKKGRGGKSHIL